MVNADELARLNVERHGAIRVGTAERYSSADVCHYGDVPGELLRSRRQSAGTFDSISAIDDASLARNPFRVFTSFSALSLSR